MVAELSPSVVTALLRERLDASLDCVSVERGPMGNAQETWFVDARSDGEPLRRLVLRRSAGSGTLAHTDRRTEFRLLATLAGHGFPVPRVHWLEDEPSSLGRPYFVMDRVPGEPVARAPAAQRDAIARELGGWLGRLHALDPAALDTGLPAPPSAPGATRAQLALWRERYETSRLAPVPLLGALLAWLEAHVPEDRSPPRLLWADAGPHNLLVDGGRITALLDWELAHVGDPLEDLGAAVWACLPGTLDAAAVIDGYEAVAGAVDRKRLRYFEAMACATRSVMLVAGVAAFVGGTSGPAAAALGQHLLIANLARAAQLARWEPGVGVTAEAPALRPDVAETAAGVASYLRAAVLQSVDEPRVRRELKTAAALLDTAAARARPWSADTAGDAALEAAATRAELERSPDRAPLRARLLAGLEAQREAIRPLEELYGRRR